MVLTDIMTMVKNGFKFAEIKELIELTKDIPVAAEDVSLDTIPSPSMDSIIDSENESEQLNNTVTESNPETVATKEDTTDYKKLYEETQQKLAIAQENNRNMNRGNLEPIDNDKLLLDMFRDYIS